MDGCALDIGKETGVLRLRGQQEDKTWGNAEYTTYREVLAAVFCDVKLRRLVNSYRCFKGS